MQSIITLIMAFPTRMHLPCLMPSSLCCIEWFFIVTSVPSGNFHSPFHPHFSPQQSGCPGGPSTCTLFVTRISRQIITFNHQSQQEEESPKWVSHCLSMSHLPRDSFPVYFNRHSPTDNFHFYIY